MISLDSKQKQSIRLLPLSQLLSGQSGKIVDITSGWHLRRRLNQIGIHIGDQLVVKRNTVLGGPVLILIHHCEIALGKGMAEKIIIHLNE
ncbi:ferrous iron transport protein A [candidate division KSB1 bacterium]|nr:ferrous iron transport protein A [candidate division KSB1 bacterium]